MLQNCVEIVQKIYIAYIHKSYDIDTEEKTKKKKVDVSNWLNLTTDKGVACQDSLDNLVKRQAWVSVLYQG